MNEGQLEISEKKTSSSVHWPTTLQFAFSSLGLIIAMSISALMLLTGVIQLTSGSPTEATAVLTYAATGAFVSLLLLPSTVISLARIMGREIEFGERWKTLRRIIHPKWSILLLLVLIPLGHWANSQETISWLVLPPVHILSVSIPIYWLVWLAIRKLLDFSPQRTWGTFNVGLVLGPAIIFTLETAVLIFFVIVGVFAFALNPEILVELELFIGRLENLAPGSPDELALYTRILNNPSVIFLILTFFSVLVPLIEEAFKSIGVWFLAGRNPTPKDGFVAGIISGAGYALFENLGNISVGASWSTLVLARIGTSVMHIFTAGLIGYTLALAWKEKRYLRLGAAYFLAILIHGLWNAFTILGTIASLEMEDAILPSYWTLTGTIALFALAVGVFVLLILANRKIRRDETRIEEAQPIAENNEAKE